MNDHPAHNPSLSELEFLVGEWDMELSNAAFLPSPTDTAHGWVTIAWIEDGGLLVMRQGEQPGQPPSAHWVIGRDESQTDFKVFYSDTRGVSRIYEMSLSGNTWRMRRESTGFSQRFEGLVSPDRATIVSKWEKSFDGVAWQHDFDLTYRRL